MSDSKRRKLALVLALLAIFIAIRANIIDNIEKQKAFGIKYFFDDIHEIERIIIYDHLDNEVARYNNNEIADLLSKYSISRPGITMSQRSSIYKKEFKKHVGELMYTIEVIFPKDRNENKQDRDIIKGSTVEVLTIHALETEFFDGDYEEYSHNINGQTCVVFLRKSLLGGFEHTVLP